jgi:hypothetical protein
MEKKMGYIVLFLTALLIVGSLSVVTASDDDVPRMTKEALRSQLHNPDLILLDVRRFVDWDRSNYKIKGAIRQDGNEYKRWADLYPKDKTLVLYCA